MLLLRRQTPSSGFSFTCRGKCYPPGFHVPAWLDDERQSMLGMLRCDACGHSSGAIEPASAAHVGVASTFKTRRVAVGPAYVTYATLRLNVTSPHFGHFVALLRSAPRARYVPQQGHEPGLST